MLKKKTIIICEGEYTTLAYLLDGGVRPDRAYFEPYLVKDYLPYIGENDTVLLILTGLTDFTSAEVNELVGLLYTTKCMNIHIFTPFPLNFLSEQYYVYEKDLLTSKLELMNVQKERGTKEGVLRRQKKETTLSDFYFLALFDAEVPFNVNMDVECQVIERVARKSVDYEDITMRRYWQSLVAVRMWN